MVFHLTISEGNRVMEEHNEGYEIRSKLASSEGDSITVTATYVRRSFGRGRNASVVLLLHDVETLDGVLLTKHLWIVQPFKMPKLYGGERVIIKGTVYKYGNVRRPNYGIGQIEKFAKIPH